MTIAIAVANAFTLFPIQSVPIIPVCVTMVLLSVLITPHAH